MTIAIPGANPLHEPQHGELPSASLEEAKRRVFDAECARHHANQAHIDAWITAAEDKLHAALVDLESLDAAAGHPWR